MGVDSRQGVGPQWGPTQGVGGTWSGHHRVGPGKHLGMQALVQHQEEAPVVHKDRL